MKAALQMLGYPRVHHAYELYVHPEQCNDWLAAWNTKSAATAGTALTSPQYWNHILGAYDAVTDMPAVCFTEELIRAYPNAKVILTEREPASWYKSFDGVIAAYWNNCAATAVIGTLDHKLMRPIHRLWTRLFASSDGYFASTTREEMRKNAIKVYMRHNDLVKNSVVPADRLLTFDLRDGWGPLCQFLDVDVPNVPFPRVNEGDAVKEVVAAFMKRSMLRILRNLAFAAVPIVAAVLYWLRR